MPPDAEVLPLTHWNLLRMCLLWAFDSPVVPSIRRYPYCAYPCAAWLLRQGSVTLEFSSASETYGEGTWIFPRETPGRQIFSEDAHLLSIRFYIDWPNGKPLFDRSQSLTFSKDEMPAMTNAAERLVAFFQQRELPDIPCGTSPRGSLSDFLEIQPLFSNWVKSYYETMVTLGQAPESIGALHQSLRRALSYLNNRSFCTPFHERELVPVCHLSLSQINKLFIQQAKTTPFALWNYRRLNVAQQELSNNRESIKSIAFNLGFSSPETFSRWFHQQTGYAPRIYRALRQ